MADRLILTILIALACPLLLPIVMGVGPVYLEYVYANGYIGSDKVKNVKKTGRHFPEIAEVLAKMKEE